MLMGIRPDRMQALAWGLSAARAGIAGALMATVLSWSPSVGETFGLIAFVVVALGGFGSVPGALYAGLIIGLIQAVSAFWLGADLQGHRRLRAVRRAAVVPAAGPDGEGVKMHVLPRVACAACRGAASLIPAGLRTERRSIRDIGVLLLLAAISALGLEHRRRLCRAGLGRPRHVLRRSAPMLPLLLYHAVRLAAARRHSGRHRRSASCWRSPSAMPTFRLTGHYFSMATIAVAELIRIFVGTWDSRRRRHRPAGPGDGARLVGPDLPQRAALLLHLPRRARAAAAGHLARSQRRRFGFYLRAIKAERARGAQPRRAGAARPRCRR